MDCDAVAGGRIVRRMYGLLYSWVMAALNWMLLLMAAVVLIAMVFTIGWFIHVGAIVPLREFLKSRSARPT